MTQLTSRQFNQNPSKAKKDALSGPVFVTDRGKPSHVLLTYSEYERITSDGSNIVQALSMPGLSQIEFEPEKAGTLARPVDLS